MPTAALPAIENRLWPDGDRHDVWMVVDCARDRRIFGLLLDSYLSYSCLYSGTLAPELEAAAPHLVQLEFEDRYSRRLVEQAWGNSWGILLRSDTSLDRLRRHLRTLLMVRGPDGSRMLFRYYDPRVLRIYLPTCFPDELRTVFGPIKDFYMEGESPDTVLQFSFTQSRLVRQVHTLV